MQRTRCRTRTQQARWLGATNLKLKSRESTPRPQTEERNEETKKPTQRIHGEGAPDNDETIYEQIREVQQMYIN